MIEVAMVIGQHFRRERLGSIRVQQKIRQQVSQRGPRARLRVERPG
jgi:hypothetical protein